MTVYDLIKETGYDYDVYDDEFDACVTCCDCSEQEKEYEGDEDFEFYYKFYAGIQKLVNVVDTSHKDYITADWSNLIRHNKPILETFMYKNWKRDYEDEDDFVYEWIREFNLWGAGYTSESVYKDFVENYMSKMTRCERNDL